MEDKSAPIGVAATYSKTARRFHWWTVALIAIQAPLGFAMVYRGGTLNVWDAITNTLYNSHKLIGIVIFCLVLARLAYRLTQGAPADEPTLEWWQKVAAHATHWSLYLLLLLVPIAGYLGISLYPALDVFGIPLPSIAPANQPAAERVFLLHWIGAVLILLLVSAHVGAALFHYFIRKDGVLQRMWIRADRRV
jgi:cytochrome b561